MKLIITAGGGGHFFPALSVIDALAKDTNLLVIGRKYALEGDRALSLEYQTAKSRNLPFRTIITGRLQRRFTKYTLLSLIKFPLGCTQAFLILSKFRPNIVLSFGGYISLPVVLSAFLLRIPVVIHEQTLGAGLANKISSVLAKKICISWDSSYKYFPKEKTVLTGNPIRKEILNPKKQSSIFNSQLHDKAPIIYITGGSLGSHAINIIVEGCLIKLLQKYILIHQTGDAQKYKDYERLEKLRLTFNNQLKERYIIAKFVDPSEIGYILKKSDLVISRAGMTTITELVTLGKPSLFIPIPFSQKNEQMKNALFVKSLGLGEVVEQEKLTPAILLNLVDSMIEKINIYKSKVSETKNSIHIRAAEKIISILQEVVDNKRT